MQGLTQFADGVVPGSTEVVDAVGDERQALLMVNARVKFGPAPRRWTPRRRGCTCSMRRARSRSSTSSSSSARAARILASWAIAHGLVDPRSERGRAPARAPKIALDPHVHAGSLCRR